MSAGLVFADTDVIIDFFNGVEPMASLVEDLIIARRLRLSAVAVFELKAGVIGSRRMQAIDRLLKVVPTEPFGAPEATLAASQYTTLKQKGRAIGNGDLMIAATCLQANAPLLTRNLKHFKRVDGLQLHLA